MLSSKEIKIIVEAFKPHCPLSIGVFGSFARNEETEKSDIDLVYEFDRPVSLFTIAGIQIVLEEKLKRKVDVVSVGGLHPELKPNILSNLKVLYAAA